MTVFLAAFAALFVLGALGWPKAWSVDADDFMSQSVTSCINGFFICLVFLSHARSYVPEESFGPLDAGFIKVISFLGQLVVTTFLFYSGYGIMESIKRKEGYIKALPAKRIMPFLLDVWIALAVYLAIMPLRGAHTNVETVLLSLVGWKSLGNSNWYIFAILCMWVFTYVAFRIFPGEKDRYKGVVVVTVLALAYIVVLRRDGIGTHFYNTALCYPAGMFFSLALPKMRSMKSLRVGRVARILLYGVLLVVAGVAFFKLHELRGKGLIWYLAMTVSFCALVVVLQMPLKHVSLPLVFAGKNLFFFYIYQRVPMILFSPLAARGTFLYVTCCLAACIPLCLLMASVHKRLKSFILS